MTTILAVSGLRYASADRTLIDCVLTYEAEPPREAFEPGPDAPETGAPRLERPAVLVGPWPFTAADEPGLAGEVFARAKSGEWGEIAPYAPASRPPLFVSGAQIAAAIARWGPAGEAALDGLSSAQWFALNAGCMSDNPALAALLAAAGKTAADL